MKLRPSEAIPLTLKHLRDEESRWSRRHEQHVDVRGVHVQHVAAARLKKFALALEVLDLRRELRPAYFAINLH